MRECNGILTLVCKGIYLSKTQGPKNDIEPSEMDNILYTQAIGCLMYDEYQRCDIYHATRSVSRYQANLRKDHYW